MPGYVKIFRSLQDSFIWQDKPFNYASAWIDLIMLANHNGNKFLLGTQLIEVNRGEFITSQDKLAKRWGWGNTKLRSFLKLLENEKMIVQKSTRKQTAIEIVNYSVYQHSQIENKPIPNRYQTDTKPIPNTNNNEKNEKNVKNDKIEEEIPYGEIIEFLNQKVGTQYKSTTESYKTLIRARWNQGYRLEAFQKVITNKANDWMGTEQAKYLRPETLFGTKFDSYLNQLVTVKIQPSQFDNNEEMRVYRAGTK